MKTLYELTAQMRQIEDTLEETGGELTPELEETWNETGESLVAKVDNYNALINHMDAYCKNLDTEIKRLQALKKTGDNSLKRIKEHVRDVMIANGIDKLEGEYCKMSLSTSTSTEVDEETLLQKYNEKKDALQAELPSWLTVKYEISKSALKEAFKDKGVMPAGVTFKENKSLRIR